MPQKTILEEQLLPELNQEQYHFIEQEKDTLDPADTLDECSAVFSHMSEGYCRHELVYDETGRPVDYRILELNAAYQSICGFEDTDVLGRAASEVYDGVTEPPYLDIFASVAQTGRTATFETFYPPLDMHFRVSVFSPRPGEFVTLYFDVTEYVENKEALQKAVKKAEREKAKFEAIVADIGDPLVIIDPNHRIIYQNTVAIQLYGNNLGKNCCEVYQNKVKRCEDCALAATFTDGEIHKVEQQLSTDEGINIVEIAASALTDHAGKKVASIEIVHDVTARKRLEEQLQGELALYSAIVESAPDGLLVLDHEGNLLASNLKLRALWGLSDAAMASQEKTGILRQIADMQEEPAVFLDKAEVLGQQVQAESNDILHLKDGRIFKGLSKPLLVDGATKGRVWCFRDITRRKKATITREQRLKELQRELVTAGQHGSRLSPCLVCKNTAAVAPPPKDDEVRCICRTCMTKVVFR